MKTPIIDQPWHRPGELAYARMRRHALLHPPVTVYPAPADVVKDEDVEVRMRDGIVLRLNLFRPAGAGPFPVILSAHPYGKDRVPEKTGGGWKINKQFRIMNQPEPLRISDQTSWEAPDPVWWVQQGYAVINLDTDRAYAASSKSARPPLRGVRVGSMSSGGVNQTSPCFTSIRHSS